MTDLPDKGSYCPIHYAVKFDHLEMIDLLSKYGANVDALDGRGFTPLIQAVFEGKRSVAARLISLRANLNIAADTGRTALHYAVSNRNYEMVSLLVGNGADIHRRDSDGSTPLKVAIFQFGDTKGALFLLTHGARGVTHEEAQSHVPDLTAKQWKDAVAAWKRIPIPEREFEPFESRGGPSSAITQCPVCQNALSSEVSCSICGRRVCSECASKVISLRAKKSRKKFPICDTCFNCVTYL